MGSDERGLDKQADATKHDQTLAVVSLQERGGLNGGQVSLSWRVWPVTVVRNAVSRHNTGISENSN